MYDYTFTTNEKKNCPYYLQNVSTAEILKVHVNNRFKINLIA